MAVGRHTLNITGNSTGSLHYTVALSSADNNINLKPSKPTNTTVISASTGSFAKPAILATNSWGYALPGTTNFGSQTDYDSTSQATLANTKWAGILPSNNPATIMDGQLAASNNYSLSQLVYYGVNIGGDVHSDSYSSNLVYTISADETLPQPTISSITPNNYDLSSDKIKSASLGFNHAVFVTQKGLITTAGYNNYGQLGNDSTSTNMTTRSDITDKFNGKKMSYIYGGYMNTFAVAESGEIYAWGNNSYGELGTGDKNNRTTPVDITANFSPALATGEEVSQVATSKYNTLFLTNKGDVYMAGNKMTAIPRRINQNEVNQGNVIQIAASNDTLYCLLSDGSIYAWGKGSGGELGNKASDDSYDKFVKVAMNAKASKISANGNTAYALTDDGHLYGWGNNRYQQLTSLVKGNVNYVVDITAAFPDIAITNIYAMSESGLVVDDSYHIYTWGRGDHGQLGNGVTTTSSGTPSDITKYIGLGDSDIYMAQLTTGLGTGAMVGLTSENRLLGWGNQINYGQDALVAFDATSNYIDIASSRVVVAGANLDNIDKVWIDVNGNKNYDNAEECTSLVKTANSVECNVPSNDSITPGSYDVYVQGKSGQTVLAGGFIYTKSDQPVTPPTPTPTGSIDVYIGDSIVANNASVGVNATNRWSKLVSDADGVTDLNVAIPGTGFIKNSGTNYSSQIDKAVTQIKAMGKTVNDVRRVYLVGGGNDLNESQSAEAMATLQTAMSTTADKVKMTFPKSQWNYIPEVVSQTTTNAARVDKMKPYLPAIYSLFSGKGFNVAESWWDWLPDPYTNGYAAKDDVHTTPKAHNGAAHKIVEWTNTLTNGPKIQGLVPVW